jgi:hypothetical protein
LFFLKNESHPKNTALFNSCKEIFNLILLEEIGKAGKVVDKRRRGYVHPLALTRSMLSNCLRKAWIVGY